jgi:hypothetical protein
MAERITTDFGSLDPNGLRQRGMAVVLALTGNVRFPNPPVTMAMLRSRRASRANSSRLQPFVNSITVLIRARSCF